MIAKYITLFFILLFVLSQAIPNTSKNIGNTQDQSIHSETVIKDSADFGYEKNYKVAIESLKKAKADREKSIAYFQMGDAKYKLMKYYDALKYFQKSYDHSQKINSHTDMFITNIYLSSIYNEIGIVSKAESSWEIAKEISKKLNNPDNEYILYNLKYNNLVRENKFCEAIQYKVKVYYYNKKEIVNKNSKNIFYDYMASLSYLIYSHLKCGDLHSAKKFTEEFEKVYNPSKDDIGYYLLEVYYLDKALISVEENKTEDARIWFDKAIKRAKYFHNKRTLKMIIEERLHHNIGDSPSEQKYFKEYLELHNQAIKESTLAYNEEFKSQEKTSEKQKSNIKTLIFVSVILAISIILILYYNFKRKKQVKSYFEAIIKNLEQKNSVIAKDISEKEESIEIEKISIRQKVISESKEAELLQKLEEFEKGTEFTSKNFTIANLSSILDTNSKYTNYILKEHRNKSFNEYINGLKVNFIVQQLYNHPETLNYKINYLSDLAGFSSHSRFASNFRNELNMSPSEFISQLAKKNKNS